MIWAITSVRVHALIEHVVIVIFSNSVSVRDLRTESELSHHLYIYF